MDDMNLDIRQDIDIKVLADINSPVEQTDVFSCIIIFAETRSAGVFWRGQRMLLHKGEWVALDGREPFACEHAGDAVHGLVLSGELAVKYAPGIAIGRPAPLTEAGRLGAALKSVLAVPSSAWTETQRAKLAFELLIALMEHTKDTRQRPRLVADACAVMDKAYGHIYGVEDLADQLGVNEAHLIRAFRSAMDMTPGEYLKNVRMENAKRFLANRELDLNMVAGLTGYANANYFGKVFKKTYGISPKAYQQMAAEKTSARDKNLPGEVYL